MKDRTYQIARNLKYDEYQRTLANMVHTFFDKKTESRVSVNEQLAVELLKPVIKKFKRRKAYARFWRQIWTADLVEMKSLFLKNKNVKYLCVIDIFTKYVWAEPLQDHKIKQFLMLLLR